MKVKNLRLTRSLTHLHKTDMFYKKVVNHGEAGLHFHKGRLVEILEPGSYKYWGSDHEIRRVDILPKYELVGGQEITTSDGATIKVSVLVSYRIENPRLALDSGYLTNVAESGAMHRQWRTENVTAQSFHVAVQIAMREWIEPKTYEDVLARKFEMQAEILPVIVEAGRKFGLAVEYIDVRDFNLTGPLKQAHAELLKTEVEGKIMLARARNEAAALRNLLNSARLVREHPKLLELRILAAGQKPKVTFVVNGSDAVGEVESPVQNDLS